MTRRLPSSERRDQIAEATLALLAEVPLSGITTRSVAAAVGISQPGLFRHFDSREALIEEALAHARTALGEVADTALASPGTALDRLGALVMGILSYVSSHPGVARLLFHDAAEGSPFREPLRQLAEAQRRLFMGLVADGAPEVDADRAARLLLALIQGVVLQWQMSGRSRDLGRDGQELLALWRAGLPAVAGVPADDAPVGEALISLDVRPLLARGEEPLETILAAVDRLAPDGVLALSAPFRPGPLVRLLSARGFAVEDHPIDAAHWVLEVRGPQAPVPVDLRDLPAPEPLEQVLDACHHLAPGAALLARVPQVPRLLLPRLDERGLVWAVHEEPDGTALLHVRRTS